MIGTSLRMSSNIGPSSNNKNLYFLLVSAVLSALLVYLISVVGDRRYDASYYHSPRGGGGGGGGASNSKKRYGLGAGDAGGELASALRRGGDGRAAVAIIRVVDHPSSSLSSSSSSLSSSSNAKGGGELDNNIKYLVQVKSHDYPIEAFRGTVCLLGGNANAGDDTPLDTLRRELGEELYHPDWIEDIVVVSENGGGPSSLSSSLWGVGVIDDSKNGRGNSTYASSEPGTIRYLGASMHFHSSSLINSHNPYAFLCALYEITISSDMLPPGAVYPRGANVREGRTVLLTEDQLVQHSKYAWGYDHTMGGYFGREVWNRQAGAAVSAVDDRTWKDTVWTPGKK